MAVLSFLIVVIFLWLIFNLPIQRDQVPDSYEYFLQKKKERESAEVGSKNE